MVKEPVGSFPHDNRWKAPPPSTVQHGNADVRGGCVASYVQAGFASHDQLFASLAPHSWRSRGLATESLLLPETPSLEPLSWPQHWPVAEPLLRLLPKTPWFEPPSWHWRWLAAESLSLLEIPSQELVVSRQYLIVSHKFFACLSESLGVKSASHQQSLRVQFLQSYSTSSQTVLN